MKRISLVSLAGILVALGCGRNSESQGPAPSHSPPTPPALADETVPASALSFSSCASHTLRVDINEGDQATKKDITSLWRALAGFPELRPRPLETGTNKLSLLIQAPGCQDDSCAAAQGWDRLQGKLAKIPGVQISCESGLRDEAITQDKCAGPADSPVQDDPRQDAPKQDQPKQDEPKQEQPGQDQGGTVGIGN